MSTPAKSAAANRWWPRWRLAAFLIAAGLTLFLLFRGGGTPPESGLTFAARRGPLDITVLEGGSVQALESQEIKCEVRTGHQGIKILKIVEEGYQVTQEDILAGKILVELDSSEIERQILQQEIQYQSAAATLIDAEQNYEIQVNQNLSDLQAAEQKVRFARMDFDKFLGETLAHRVLKELEIEQQLADRPSGARRTSPVTPPPGPQMEPGTLIVHRPASSDESLVQLVEEVSSVEPLPLPDAIEKPEGGNPASGWIEAPMVDFGQFATLETLGDGEAKQRLRKLEDDLQVAVKELGQAEATLEGTRRLYDREFVTRIDLQRDEINFENSRLKVQTAETARDLFLRFELIKSAEENLSKYAEAVRELARARKAAISKLAQAEARLRSAEGQFNVQTRQRNDLQEQLEKCIIHAEKPGLVVYGGGREQMFYGGEERIREGATIRERQAIITIPDMTRMSLQVRIHESYIKKIKAGQPARVIVDAFADRTLTGSVTNVGVLPDSENRWMNPDLKVYRTTISIEGVHDWLKPGMSAKAEILVDRLDDVVFVPIQAVTPRDGRRVCHVVRGVGTEVREVEVGQFNDEFIEIKSGLADGEKVLLRPPRTSDSTVTPESSDPSSTPPTHT
jgi:HlyD family secretion protein